MIQMTCKDRNRNALLSDIIGAAIAGIKHILITTGDWPKFSDDPLLKPVFDIDSVRLIYVARLLSDKGIDHRNRRIHQPLRIHVFATSNPFLEPLDVEIKRCILKVKAGAEALFTQPVINLNKFEEYIRRLKQLGIDIGVIATIAVFRKEEDIKVFEEYLRTSISREFRITIDNIDFDLFEKIVNHITSLDLVKGIHIATFGKHEIGAKLGEIVKRVLGL